MLGLCEGGVSGGESVVWPDDLRGPWGLAKIMRGGAATRP